MYIIICTAGDATWRLRGEQGTAVDTDESLSEENRVFIIKT